MKRIVKIMLVLSIAAILGTAPGCDNDNKKKDEPKTYLKGGDPAKIPGVYMLPISLSVNSPTLYSYFGAPDTCFVALSLNSDGTYSAQDVTNGHPPTVFQSGTWEVSGNELIFHPSGGGEFVWYWELGTGELIGVPLNGLWIQSSDWPATLYSNGAPTVNEEWLQRES